MTELSIEQQEKIHNEIIRVYDLIEGIVDTISSLDLKDQQQQFSLSESLIAQLTKSADEFSECFLECAELDQKCPPALVKRAESTLRKAFNKGTEFQNELKKIAPDPAYKVQNLPNNLLESEILPKVGMGVGELQPGDMWNTFEQEINRIPKFEKLIRSVRAALSHLWRIIYYFASINHELVSNPHNIIWGRKISDLKAQALLERDRVFTKGHKETGVQLKHLMDRS